jgi:hypothetical protein
MKVFGSDAIEVFIGLTVIYFVFSVMASAFTEAVSSLLALRSNDLKHGITMLLQGDQASVNAFFEHPVIKALRPPGSTRFRVGKQLPSYIPADLFARVYKSMYDGKILTATAAPASVFEAFGGANVDARALQKELEAWFNASMDRVTGWFKRKARFIVLAVGAVVVIGANADTISIANSLWQDPTIRARTVAIAENQTGPNVPLDDASKARDDLTGLTLLGWVTNDEAINDPREVPAGLEDWIEKIIGLAVTIGAVSMGAPFWFDLMKLLLSFRPKQEGQQSVGNSGNIPEVAVVSTSATDTSLPTPVAMT